MAEAERGGSPAVQPLFVVGLPRSGTSLTAEILGRHSEVLSLGETHFFEELTSGITPGRVGKMDSACLRDNAYHLYQSLERHKYRDILSQIEDWFSADDLVRAASEGGSTVGALYRAFIRLASDHASHEHWVCDDTPRHLFHLASALDWFPEAKIVVCVRDPRDFMCSYKNYWKKAAAPERRRIQRLYHPLLTSLYWRSGINVLGREASQLPEGRVLAVRYEDLVMAPEARVKELCSFLELPFEPAMLEVERANSSFDVGRKGIFTESVGRWRSCLDPEEVWYAQRLNGSRMKKHQYEVAPVTPSVWGVLRILASSPPAALSAIWSNRRRTESLLTFLLRRARAALAR